MAVEPTFTAARKFSPEEEAAQQTAIRARGLLLGPELDELVNQVELSFREGDSEAFGTALASLSPAQRGQLVEHFDGSFGSGTFAQSMREAGVGSATELLRDMEAYEGVVRPSEATATEAPGAATTPVETAPPLSGDQARVLPGQPAREPGTTTRTVTGRHGRPVGTQQIFTEGPEERAMAERVPQTTTDIFREEGVNPVTGEPFDIRYGVGGRTPVGGRERQEMLQEFAAAQANLDRPETVAAFKRLREGATTPAQKLRADVAAGRIPLEPGQEISFDTPAGAIAGTAVVELPDGSSVTRYSGESLGEAIARRDSGAPPPGEVSAPIVAETPAIVPEQTMAAPAPITAASGRSRPRGRRNRPSVSPSTGELILRTPQHGQVESFFEQPTVQDALARQLYGNTGAYTAADLQEPSPTMVAREPRVSGRRRRRRQMSIQPTLSEPVYLADGAPINQNIF